MNGFKIVFSILSEKMINPSNAIIRNTNKAKATITKYCVYFLFFLFCTKVKFFFQFYVENM